MRFWSACFHNLESSPWPLAHPRLFVRELSRPLGLRRQIWATCEACCYNEQIRCNVYLRIHNDKQPFIPQCMYKGNTTLCKFSCCRRYNVLFNSILPMVSSFKNKIGTVVPVLPTAPISICRSLNIGTFGRYNKCLKSLPTLPFTSNS